MKFAIPSLSRHAMFAIMTAMCVTTLFSGCKPGNRTLCRSLADLAETHGDDSGEAWQIALDATLSDEETCIAYLDRIAQTHEDEWADVSLCYVRSSEWSDVATCDRVVATLDVSDVCYHRLELEAVQGAETAEEADDGQEATDRRTVEYARRTALAGCVDEERLRYREVPELYPAYTDCVLEASSSDDAAACIPNVEEAVEEPEPTDSAVEQVDGQATPEAGDTDEQENSRPRAEPSTPRGTLAE